MFAARFFPNRFYNPRYFASGAGQLGKIGPGAMVVGQSYNPGFKAGDTTQPSMLQGQEYHPGFKAGDVK